MSQIAERPVQKPPRHSQHCDGARPAAESTPAESSLVSVTRWWRRHPDLGPLLIVLSVGIVLRLALLYRVPPLFMPGDSQSFLTPAYDLARGLGFDPIL